jgi:hypothetical protein
LVDAVLQPVNRRWTARACPLWVKADIHPPSADPLGHLPWNKGKLTGAKPPLRPKHVWSIRSKLQLEGRARDLAMFNLAIDSKRHGCDVVALKVGDIAPNGYSVERATIRQKKIGQAVRLELTEQSRQSVHALPRPLPIQHGSVTKTRHLLHSWTSDVEIFIIDLPQEGQGLNCGTPLRGVPVE